ncbi:sensor histidine kinase [Actinoalloteichus spitiensis]|uniref:sensor histidine kinase n=1 Tax=Actinoalloteichus spitiensis TaxID=252394 RepID=UPI000360F14E|nr:ATP-binding protein [Actinoalloteichus spitiensis]
MGYLALSISLVLVGGILGFVAGRLSERRPRRGHGGVTVAELLRRLVSSSHSGVAVLNRFGDVLFHNKRAVELGVVTANVIDPRAGKAAERALAENRVIAVDLPPTGGARKRRPEAVAAEVRPLGEGFTVVDAADESEAVRLEATRRDFVANVSHELKTPVGALALLAEAMLDAADEPDEVRRFSEKIRHEATRLGALTSELIVLSRLQGAEPLPDPDPVSVDAVVDEALGRCRLTAEAAGITVTTDPHSGLMCAGDGVLLTTALSNLLANAIAYSPEGSAVSVSRRLREGMVEIAVTDRGLGIAPEHQERVFERFFRVDPARSRATGGTGLGLAIVKHVANNHGGSVRLWSLPGTGSTFTLSLPALDAKEPRGGEERPLAAASAGGTGTTISAQPRNSGGKP